MLQRKNSKKAGRPKQVDSTGRMLSTYMDDSDIKDFIRLCEETGISTSEGLRQLVKQELTIQLEKKEQGLVNPLNIPYNSNALLNKPTSLQLPLDDFITKDDINKLIERSDNPHILYANAKNMLEAVHYKITGKAKRVQM